MGVATEVLEELMALGPRKPAARTSASRAAGGPRKR
jgi:hypothetical protein